VFGSEGGQLCAVLFALHPSVPSDHPLRRGIEAVDEEVTADHDALLTHRLGTGVVACFPTASAALAAAVALHQSAVLHHPEHPPAIGVSAGEVLLHDDDNIGMTTVVAARLAAVAAPGDTLATDIALALAEEPSAPPFVDHHLKGVPEPVPAARLRWDQPPTVAAALGVPPALHTGEEPFAGRVDELAAVRARLERLTEGEGGVVVVTGEAGAGKSALLARIADVASQLDRPVLYGRCDADVQRPYAPLAEMVRRVVERDPRGSVALGSLPGELTRVVPEVAERFPRLPPPVRSEPDVERAQLLDAFRSWLQQCGAVGAVLMVDDLHWADPDTIGILAELCELARSSGVLIVAGARPTTGPAHDLLVDLRRAQALDLRLQGLEPDDIATLLPSDADPTLAATLHRRSSGNPFFVRELLRAVADTGEDVHDTAPVREVVLRRIAGLSDGARTLLSAASVMGLSFDSLLLVDVGAADAGAFVDLLDEAITEGVVVERVDDFQIAHEFVHALTRDALYEDMSTLRRARLHQQLALALEQRGATADELAHHFRAAVVVGEAARALRYTLLAADGALAAFANEQALDGYRQAAVLLDALGDSAPEQRIDVDTRIGECLRRLGRPDYLPVLFGAAAAASARGDGARMAAALMASYRGSFHQAFVVNQELIELLERALALLGDGESSIRALLLARLAVELAWSERLDRAREHSDEAVRLAEGLDDEVVLARVLVLRQWTLFDSLDERLDWQRRTDAIVRRGDDPVLLLEALDMAYFNAERAGDGEAAERLFAEAEVVAERLDSAMAWWNFTRMITTRCARVGDEARRLAGVQRAYEVGTAARQPDVELRRSGEVFWIGFDHGEVEDQAATMAATWQIGHYTPFGLGSSIAHHCLDLGLTAEAGELYQSLRHLVASPLHHQTWMTVQCQLAHLATGLGELDDALAIEAVLAGRRDQIANIWFTGVGAVARYLGEVRLLDGDLPGAIEEFDHACAVNRRAGAVGWLARTCLDLAPALRRRDAVGDRDRAAALVAEAVAIAERHHYPLIAERAASMTEVGDATA